MCSDVVIRAEGLTKTYRVFGQSADRLKQAVTFGRRQYYKRFTALDNVSFEIRKGETVGIIGRNGSGKSTLLQLVCGILKPSAGRVEVNGRISALLELGAGFHPDFTGRENVLFYANVLGMPSVQIERRLPEIESFADIGEFIDQPVRTYSSGMYVRLAFATAIHTDPEILVVDEALAVGDTVFQSKCLETVRSIAASGVTVLFVTHDASLVAQLCDSALLIDQGRLLLRAEPSKVLHKYHSLMTNLAPIIDNAEEAMSYATSHISPRPLFYSAQTAKLRDAQVLPSLPSRGATIQAVKVLDQEGEPVSKLIANQKYSLECQVSFECEASRVVAGFTVKTARGVELGGVLEPALLDPVMAGQTCIFVLPFTCRLLAGEYCMTINVRGRVSDSAVFLDRVIDALAFRVEAETSPKYTGHVDLSV